MTTSSQNTVLINAFLLMIRQPGMNSIDPIDRQDAKFAAINRVKDLREMVKTAKAGTSRMDTTGMNDLDRIDAILTGIQTTFERE